jgi:hypothetical protein
MSGRLRFGECHRGEEYLKSQRKTSSVNAKSYTLVALRVVRKVVVWAVPKKCGVHGLHSTRAQLDFIAAAESQSRDVGAAGTLNTPAAIPMDRGEGTSCPASHLPTHEAAHFLYFCLPATFGCIESSRLPAAKKREYFFPHCTAILRSNSFTELTIIYGRLRKRSTSFGNTGVLPNS